MGATSGRGKIGGGFAGGLLASRRGGIYIAVLAAVAAGVLIFAFVQKYKTSASGGTSTETVFVTNQVIHRGTPASVAAGMLTKTTVPVSRALPGAVTDPAIIAGAAAATDIPKDSQITSTEFVRATVSVSQYLTGNQRAISVPIDATHAVAGAVQTGDHVDVIATGAGSATNGVVSVLGQGLLVLAVSPANITLQATDQQELALAAFSDGGKIWITLRPPNGAQNSIAPGVRVVARP